MSATDDLRALLDKRGVEHWDGSEHTCWGLNDDDWYDYSASEGVANTLHVHMHGQTPAQAVEATLGRGECRDKGNIERFICSECGCRLDLQDDDWEATMWVDEAAMVPNYCPNCGRRVKEDA